MAQISVPLPSANRQLTDAEYEAVVAGYSEDGLTDGTPSTQPPIYADGSGLNVKIRPDRWAVLRAYLWHTDSAGDTVDLQAADTSARTDLIVLRLDRSTWAVSVAAVKGTPGAGVPDPTRDTGDSGVYEIPWAEVDVAANATSIGASAVRSRAWYLSRNGTILCTSSTLPPAAPGRTIYDTETATQYLALSYSSDSWRVTSEDTGYVPVPFAAGNWTAGGATPMICRKDGWITLRLGDPEKVGGLAANADSHIIDLPPGFRSGTFHRGIAQIAGGSGALSIYESGNTNGRANQVWLVNHPAISDGQQIWCADVTYRL